MSNAGILQVAHDFVLNNPIFNDNHNIVPYKKGSGLKILLGASMPDVFHDSSARDPPPSCHPGTHHDFIDMITSWGLGTSQHTEPILWMYGPAGVRKLAIAQTCSEGLAERDKLGATLFFSHSDLTLVTKSIKEQFQELLVKPFLQLRADTAGIVEGLVIIIDSLDECGKGPGMHCDIIKIQQRNGLPDSWVSERNIGVLVNLSGGLYIYAAMVIQFIGSHELLSPVDQLCAVLTLANNNKGTDSIHPLSELDLFYTLIM
ncbi:hypothetical protein P691DRAFT_785505 [Macrolepiota fuliginosa MF-IS2]|uniref:NACHT domain-containing protein n=1 Tax=Macrolepiota fuliginosa MF-IS2 TaxID=1400762 RepID=A0A9P5X667_9AGAR|nr:hypothetical protein P691DRAFT_785505 [Macrolepiota fuliginosa MF-IS2]